MNPVASGRRPGGFERGVVALLHGLARHWLCGANVFSSAYLGLALLAPILMAAGHALAAEIIYTVYSPLCHQWPDRSYFMYGPQVQYSLSELRSWLGTEVTRYYVGEPALGYKTAMCQRCIAMFGVILVAGLLYAIKRRRVGVVKPLSWWSVALLLVPVAVDGGGQLIGLWESTWWSRSVTGMLFGIAWVGWVYPYVDSAMRDVLQSAENVSDPEGVWN